MGENDREDTYEKIKKDYKKVVEEASEKIQIAEECYSLVDRYLRKLVIFQVLFPRPDLLKFLEVVFMSSLYRTKSCTSSSWSWRLTTAASPRSSRRGASSWTCHRPDPAA